MPDPCGPLRTQIRSLQAQRRVLESKLMQPQSLLAALLIERFLGASGSPRRSPAYYLSRFRAGSFQADLCQKGGVGYGAPALRRLPRLPAGSEGVATDYRRPGTGLEAVAAGPVPIKHFFRF